ECDRAGGGLHGGSADVNGSGNDDGGGSEHVDLDGGARPDKRAAEWSEVVEVDQDQTCFDSEGIRSLLDLNARRSDRARRTDRKAAA
ncbi:MAG TPA: hypothetical protein PLI95_29480, partial [Polyangiaceae bacterium]|nr:hypothetical protein [Polyangiaceae bacterium]